MNYLSRIIFSSFTGMYLQMWVHLIQQNTCLWVAHGNNEGVSPGWRELYNTADDDGKQNSLVTGTRHSPPSRPPDTPPHVPPAWLSPRGIPAVPPTHAQPAININHIIIHTLIGGGRMKLKKVMTYSFHRFDCLSARHDCLFICLPRHLTARNLQLLTSQHTQVCISLHYVCCL